MVIWTEKDWYSTFEDTNIIGVVGFHVINLGNYRNVL